MDFDRSPLVRHRLTGFVLACSRRLTLVHELHDFVPRGYQVIRNRDVAAYRVETNPQSFARLAVRLLRLQPVPAPGVTVADWPAVLRSSGARFPLLTVHFEAKDPDVCYVGRFARATTRTFMLELIDSDARWIGERTFAVAELTRLDFGGSYETALLRVARHRARAGRPRRARG